MLRRQYRWETPFGRWVRHLGVSRVVRGLHGQHVTITPSAVYKYVAGTRSPGLEVRSALSRLSRGTIRPQDIDRHILCTRTGASSEIGR
jgi:hypothetical protein